MRDATLTKALLLVIVNGEIVPADEASQGDRRALIPPPRCGVLNAALRGGA